MQDGAPFHRSYVDTEFLKKNEMSALEWPVNTPYLNPIENRWTIVKDKMAYRQPSNAVNRRQVIKEVLVNEITQEYRKSVVPSMSRRIQAEVNSKEYILNTANVVTLTRLDVTKFQTMLYFIV